MSPAGAVANPVLGRDVSPTVHLSQIHHHGRVRGLREESQSCDGKLNEAVGVAARSVTHDVRTELGIFAQIPC